MRNLLYAVCVALLLTATLVVPADARPFHGPNTAASGLSSIKHVVFLVQENRAFDDLFGSYCTVLGKYCPNVSDGTPPGTCVPINPSNPSSGCVRPYNFTSRQLLVPDMPHVWANSHFDWNNGSMNGFWANELRNNETFGEYNGSTVPVYWNLAEEYSLSDQFFSSAQSYSLPNHWYLVSDKTPALGLKTFHSYLANFAVAHQYLNESNATPTVEDSLINSSVSWKYYDNPLTSYTKAISTLTNVGLSAYSFWMPLAAREQSYAKNVSSHFVVRSQFLTDAAKGNLPALSWIMPASKYSDHPGQGNLSAGQAWVASVVNAVESSPEWNSTVLFLTWDDYGGFYDHVAPPFADANGDGFRVPLLAIGPYVRQGYVSHTVGDFGSILRFMESQFGLPCLGARDCGATLPLDVFDFSQAPRAPIIFGNYTAGATYPLPEQSALLNPRLMDTPYVPPPTGVDDEANADGGTD